MRSMRISLSLLVGLGLLACDSSTPPAAIADAIVDADRPDGAPVDAATDAAPTDAAPADGAFSDAALPDAGADDGVPDDSCGAADPDAARVLPPDTPVMGEICRDQSAWFAVDVPAETEASVVLSFVHRRGDLELAIYRDRSPRARIAESTSADDVERITLPARPDAERYLVEVFGYQRAVGAFTLQTTLFDPADAVPTRVAGTVRYLDKAFDANGFTGERPALPARGTRIEAVRALDGAVVADTLTDLDGRFALDFAAQPGDHRVRAVSAGAVDGQAVEVRDIDASLRYAVDSAPFMAGADRDDLALLADADDAIGGALNIVDTTVGGFLFMAPYVDGPAPAITFRWQPGVGHACGSCYSNNVIRLAGALEDTDEYDDVIILHELWHWFVEHYSADASPGGPHRDRLVSPALAYGEGVAYAFAGLARGAPDVVDTFIDAVRHIDMEAMTIGGEDLDVLYGTTDATPEGRHREELVEGIIWDSIDPASPDEPFDTVSIGVAGGFALLTRLGTGDFDDVGARGIDVADWLGMLACEAEPQSAIALATERRYPFSADDVPCQKGQVAPPIQLGGGALISKTSTPLIVRRGRPGAWHTRTLICRDRCPLPAPAPDEAVVISAANTPWAGVSQIGVSLRAALAGRIRAGARSFPSRTK